MRSLKETRRVLSSWKISFTKGEDVPMAFFAIQERLKTLRQQGSKWVKYDRKEKLYLPYSARGFSDRAKEQQAEIQRYTTVNLPTKSQIKEDGLSVKERDIIINNLNEMESETISPIKNQLIKVFYNENKHKGLHYDDYKDDFYYWLYKKGVVDLDGNINYKRSEQIFDEYEENEYEEF